MSRKFFYVLSAAALCLAVPAAVRALHRDSGRALNCGEEGNPVCGLYQLCRPILDKYPEEEITVAGKDCTLTVESRQLIIRRKRTGNGTGYFFYTKFLPEKAVPAR